MTSTDLSSFPLTPEERKRQADLKAKHGREIYPLRVEGRLVFVAEPTPSAMDCYMDEQLDDDKKGRAATNLFRACVVEPDGEKSLVEIFADRPALLIALALNFLKVVGLRAEVTLGK